MATLADLQLRIAAVRRKERRVVLASGLFRSVVALAFAVLAYFLVDWLFDLPYAARLVFATGAMTAVGYVFWKYLLRELARIQDDDEIALRVEARNSDLRGRLISTLQLTRSSHHGEYVGSPELLAALEEETVRMSEPMDFFRIVNTETLVRLALVAVLVIVIKGALVWKFPDYFSALGVRLVHPNAHFPTKTRLKELKMRQLVVRGEDVPIEVLVEGDVPVQPGTAYCQATGRDVIVPIELVPMGGAVFKGVLTKALEDMTVRIDIGDFRSDPYLLRVTPRPEVDIGASGDCIQYRLPAYTHDNDPHPERFGGLSMLAGSTASIKFLATKPLISASLDRSDGRSFPFTKRVEKRTEGEGEKRKVVDVEWWELASLPIDKTGSFHMTLTDSDELKNSQPPVEYPIDARPDMPPSIKLVRPVKDLTVTPTAKLNVSFSARDDWGVRTTWIVYRVQSEVQGDSLGEIKRVERPLEPEGWKQVADAIRKQFDKLTDEDLNATHGTADGLAAKLIERYSLDKAKAQQEAEKATRAARFPRVIPPTIFTWDIAGLGVKPGDQIVFWLEADDECAANDNMPQGRSRRPGDAVAADPQGKFFPRTIDVKLTVISREEKIMELQTEVQRLIQVLTQQKDSQEELKTKVRILMEELRRLKGDAPE
ncbi:MAG TPA: hypothetical protein VGP72_08455 [Planctomycetota bacterium]|jgi:uncharacterized protein YjbJ (UPF0337 family)